MKKNLLLSIAIVSSLSFSVAVAEEAAEATKAPAAKLDLSALRLKAKAEAEKRKASAEEKAAVEGEESAEVKAAPKVKRITPEEEQTNTWREAIRTFFVDYLMNGIPTEEEAALYSDRLATIIENIKRCGANLPACFDVAIDEEGNRPLHIVAAFADAENLALLLENNVNPKVRNENNQTPSQKTVAFASSIISEDYDRFLRLTEIVSVLISVENKDRVKPEPKGAKAGNAKQGAKKQKPRANASDRLAKIAGTDKAKKAANGKPKATGQARKKPAANKNS